MNGSWSRAKPLVLLPAHANSVRCICMCVWPGLVPTNWSLSFSPSLIYHPALLFVSLSHVISFFLYFFPRMCKHENAKGPHLFLWPVLCLWTFVCAVMHFGSSSQPRDIQACLTLWARMRPGAAFRSLCCRFINTMQRAGINGDNYSTIEWGLLGPGLSTFLWGLFISFFPFVVYCAVVAAGTQQ